MFFVAVPFNPAKSNFEQGISLDSPGYTTNVMVLLEPTMVMMAHRRSCFLL